MVIALYQLALGFAHGLHNSASYSLHARQLKPLNVGRAASSSLSQSLIIAIILPVACFFAIGLAGFLWWREYRRQTRRNMSLARRSTRSRESRRSEGNDNRSTTNRQASRDAKSSASRQEALLLRRYPPTATSGSRSHDQDIGDQNNEHIRPNAEYSAVPGPSRWYNEALDLNVVTPAPSSPRRQFLSSVGSVIDRYAHLPDNHSRTYVQGSQRDVDVSNAFPTHRIGSEHPDGYQRDPAQLYAAASGESSRGVVTRHSDQYMRRPRDDASLQEYLPAIQETSRRRMLASPAPIREIGTQAREHDIPLELLNSVVSPPFGAPGLAAECDIRPGSSVSAGKEPMRDPPSRNENTNLTQEPSIYDTVYTLSDILDDGDAGSSQNIPEENLVPTPLRIRKSSSGYILNHPFQERETTLDQKEQQTSGSRGVQDPGPSSHNHTEKQPPALDLASIRRALSSSDEQLRISALGMHDDDETRTQRWNPVIPDTRTEGTQRSSRTLRRHETRVVPDLERGLEQSPQLEQHPANPTHYRDRNEQDPESAESRQDVTTSDSAWNTNAIINWAKRVL